jgi:hypothetical protein
MNRSSWEHLSGICGLIALSNWKGKEERKALQGGLDNYLCTESILHLLQNVCKLLCIGE